MTGGTRGDREPCRVTGSRTGLCSRFPRGQPRGHSQARSDEHSPYLRGFFTSLFGYLPNIVGFLIILVVGYLIAGIVRTVANKVLDRLKVDARVQESKAGRWVDNVSPGGRPSRLISGVVFWLIFIYALTAAIGALQIAAVTGFMTAVLAYLPNVIAAVLIFVVAAAVATAVAALVQRTMGDTPTGPPPANWSRPWCPLW